ncbi:KAP family NTPase [Aeromonas bestiarum]|uniref:KAP family NTPase n=1 Tax=Aeromonas bestiarum TaxID=105751 RepID=A0AAW7HXL2_9GAMM|nr:P-loop NTPase fold protein [Aeromonas bestiarum]MDM5140671.1 KAP family NTPase [Aeromonas bestiarum]
MDIDLFSGQGHKQVADAIAKVLYSDSSQHIIGIEGNLGAGKSTVINILKQKIEAEGFHIVTFDADQYHKNLKPALIKTIDAELNNIFDEKNKTQLKLLKEAVEKALGQRLKYTKDTQSHISLAAITFGFLLAVSALQLRPGLTFLFDLIGEKDSLSITSGIASLLLLASPAFAWGYISLSKSNMNLGDLVKRNSKDVITEVIDINREVGAIELREAFSIFADIIPKGKTLLLVIDNIDRIAPDIARELWSDIEILTSLGNERFRILLPYSEEHLAKALEKSAVDESQSGREFISKRIPVPFSAPPIVTTGWREQFDAYWSETLPDIDGRDGAKSLIDIWVNKITPRFLKSLVNRIGAKIDSCPEGNEFLNGACCAAYMLVVRDSGIPVHDLLSNPDELFSKKENNETFKDEIRKLAATHRVLKKYSGEKQDWSKQIAALHFQTSFKVAESELIAEPIRVAVNTHNTSSLVALKPLLGFDVFFKQQIEKTDSTELVKIAAALLEEDTGIELVNEYLGDINHELKGSPANTIYEFDKALVTSYWNLVKKGVKINHSPIDSRQESVTNSIKNIWNILSSLDSPMLGKSPDSLNELQRFIIDCYAYYTITKTRPYFVEALDSNFIVNALFPIARDIKDWNVERLIDQVDLIPILKESCLRHEYIEDEFSIFTVLLERCRVGILKDIDVETLLSNNKLTSISQNVEKIPFTKYWHDTNKQAFAQSLVVELSDTIHNNTAEKENINKLSACTIVAVMNAFSPVEYGSFRNHDARHDITTTALQCILTIISDHPLYKDFIVNFLSTLKYDQIMKWCKQPEITNIMLPHFEKMIKSKRIQSAVVKPLISDDYTFINKQKLTITNKEHVNWVATWNLHIKDISPKDWSLEFVDDIINYEQAETLEILQDYFDNEELTQADWLKRIKQADVITERMVDYMVGKEVTLNHQQALVNALKDIPNTNEKYSQLLVTRLTALLDPQKKGAVTRSLNVAFLKKTTTHEQRYRSIHYFSNAITMPTINGHEMAQEVIDLIENAATYDKSEVLQWLMNQPVLESGWCIDTWHSEDLEALSNTLTSIDSDQVIRLLTEVNHRLSDKKEGTDDDEEKLAIV